MASVTMLTAQMVAQVCEVLAAAHTLGIVHRDIKPSNILLVDSDRELWAKVIDFGIAKHTGLTHGDGITETGQFLGSPRFMSPEHIEDAKSVGAGADLWSLGAVAYQALLGQPAFVGDEIG